MLFLYCKHPCIMLLAWNYFYVLIFFLDLRALQRIANSFEFSKSKQKQRPCIKPRSSVEDLTTARCLCKISRFLVYFFSLIRKLWAISWTFTANQFGDGSCACVQSGYYCMVYSSQKSNFLLLTNIFDKVVFVR